jgi:hypothetical protein
MVLYWSLGHLGWLNASEQKLLGSCRISKIQGGHRLIPITDHPQLEFLFREPRGLCLGKGLYMLPSSKMPRFVRRKQAPLHRRRWLPSSQLPPLVITTVFHIGPTEVAVHTFNHTASNHTASNLNKHTATTGLLRGLATPQTRIG